MEPPKAGARQRRAYVAKPGKGGFPELTAAQLRKSKSKKLAAAAARDAKAARAKTKRGARGQAEPLTAREKLRAVQQQQQEKTSRDGRRRATPKTSKAAARTSAEPRRSARRRSAVGQDGAAWSAKPDHGDL